MKLFRRLLVAVFCGVLVSSCFEPPDYPNIPEIVFKNLRYVDVPDSPQGETGTDSLILTLKFKDGDGNLGISPSENGPPFNARWYYVRTPLTRNILLNDDCHTYASQHRCWFYDVTATNEFNKYIDYGLKRAGKSPYDTLQTFIKPYNCTKWEVVRNDKGIVVDTLVFTLNPHYSNIKVDFQTKNGDNTYTSFDWGAFLNYPSCEAQGFDGRFPIMKDNPNDGTPLEGEIRYAMTSAFFRVVFGAKTLRLKIYIEDRALNKSNEVYTNDFNF